MVLSSQSPREGNARLYMVSRRRRPKILPWFFILAVLALVAYGAYWLLAGSSQPQHAQAQPSTIAQQTTSSIHTTPTHTTSPHITSVSQLPPPRILGSRSTDPTTPTARKQAAATSTPALSVFSLQGKPVPANTNSPTGVDAANPSANPQPAPPQSASPPSNVSPTDATGDLARGMNLITNHQWIKGRKLLSQLLFSDASLSAADAGAIRDTLTSVNQQLVFSDKVYPNDPLAQSYKVQPGDLLAHIAPRYKIPYQFLERINHIKGPNLRAGQTIKLIKGPFNVRIIKHAFRLDVFLQEPDGLPIYVRSFPVGLGKANSTPLGHWIIHAKVLNPRYDNPRTGEHFGRNDPRNPVGNYWMTLQGIGSNTRGRNGYGIHGTIDPASIGHQDSLGCIRLRNPDIKHLFNMLATDQTKVQVLP